MGAAWNRSQGSCREPERSEMHLRFPHIIKIRKVFIGEGCLWVRRISWLRWISTLGTNTTAYIMENSRETSAASYGAQDDYFKYLVGNRKWDGLYAKLVFSCFPEMWGRYWVSQSKIEALPPWNTTNPSTIIVYGLFTVCYWPLQ